MVTQDEVLDRIKVVHGELENHELYFILRSMKHRHITATLIELLKWCIAINLIGFNITVELINALTQQWRDVPRKLHILGDWKVLTLIRGQANPGTGTRLRYILNPDFVKRLNEFGIVDRLKPLINESIK